MTRRLARCHHRAKNIRGEEALHLGEVRVEERRERAEAGVVDENVVVGEMLDRLLNQRDDISLDAHIRAAPVCTDFPGRFEYLRFIDNAGFGSFAALLDTDL